MKTYSEHFLAARKTLRDAGVDMYDLEARLLACCAAGKTREKFISEAHLYAAEPFISTLDEMVKRRLSGEPVAYITGEWEFYGLELSITSDVLIPRVDTEVLVTEAVSRLKAREGRTRVLDLCCGSGCIGLAIAASVPDCRVVMADISREALKVARANAMKNGLTRSVTATEAHALAKPPVMMGTFDLIACNPPYIATEELISLDPSVRDFEPVLALDGGKDGLDFYRTVTKYWRTALKPGGELVYECGEDQADAVEAIMRQYGFSDIIRVKDTIGVDRVVAGIYTGGNNEDG